MRSVSGRADDLAAGDPGQEQYADTPLLERCEYFRKVLGSFECRLKSVRLLSLAPGSFIREHSDHALDFEDGEVRIHVPILTNPGVEFYVCGERLLLEEGGCYYVNVNLPHRVNNRGDADRVHLVIDAEVNAWVRGLFENGCAPIRRSAIPPGGVDEFRKRMAEDEELRTAGDRRKFIARAVALGFHENDIECGFRSPPTTVKDVPAGWIPKTLRNPSEAEWIYAGQHRFTEPFFEDSVRVCLRRPFAAMFRYAAPVPAQNDPAPPAGLIFHMSRCGSTLVSRSLAALKRVRVLSEAEPIDQAIQYGDVDLLKRVAGALCDGRSVLKLDAWHIRSLRLIRRAFPDVPWIFIHRDPVEVLVSQLRQPGMRSIAAGRVQNQAWYEETIESFLRTAIEAKSEPKGLFVDYGELPQAIVTRIAPHFGIALSAGDTAVVREAATLDAKNPYAAFVPDTVEKRETGRSLDTSRLSDLYRRLLYCTKSCGAGS